ncbi:MAG: hypothetical protein KC656_33760 [Myxococcales bacterium]|nr:hypothetical protein [Myxococcales bacterium]
MSLGDFLRRLDERLDAAGIPFMVAGSVASSVHGAPRSTMDVDLVIDPDPLALEALVSSFPEDAYYVSRDAARAALRNRGQFNVVDFETGWKVDFIIRKNRPFSVEEFGRRARRSTMGVETWLASPEDVLLAKLEWAENGGGSDRQLADVKGILRSGVTLDDDYLDRWAEALGVRSLLQQVRESP